MSRSGGYKCYNTRCSSCLGKTLCTEPGDAALRCQDRVVNGKSEINYKTQAKDLNLVAQLFEGTGIPETYVRKVYNAAESITDLLARAEAAEAAQETLQRAMAEYKDRAEKAERERDAAIKYIRHYGWCAGCKNFRGFKGCASVGLKNCTEKNDCYEFGQKEE